MTICFQHLYLLQLFYKNVSDFFPTFQHKLWYYVAFGRQMFQKIKFPEKISARALKFVKIKML